MIEPSEILPALDASGAKTSESVAVSGGLADRLDPPDQSHSSRFRVVHLMVLIGLLAICAALIARDTVLGIAGMVTVTTAVIQSARMIRRAEVNGWPIGIWQQAGILGLNLLVAAGIGVLALVGFGLTWILTQYGAPSFLVAILTYVLLVILRIDLEREPRARL